jgi:hypothetical protein
VRQKVMKTHFHNPGDARTFETRPMTYSRIAPSHFAIFSALVLFTSASAIGLIPHSHFALSTLPHAHPLPFPISPTLSHSHSPHSLPFCPFSPQFALANARRTLPHCPKSKLYIVYCTKCTLNTGVLTPTLKSIQQDTGRV